MAKSVNLMELVQVQIVIVKSCCCFKMFVTPGHRDGMKAWTYPHSTGNTGQKCFDA